MSPRNSRVTPTQVIYSFWLVFEEAGGVRLTRIDPNLDRAERAMFISATLPRSLWGTPSLRAEIKVQPGQGIEQTINLNLAADALKGALGVDIDMRVIEP